MDVDLLDPGWKLNPTYPVFTEFEGVKGIFTGKGVDSANDYFSFHRPGSTDDGRTRANFLTNIQHLGRSNRFDPGKITMPNGTWPHSGHTIKAEEHQWVTNPKIDVLMPITADNQPITYDAIVTKSPEFILAVQGADCPAIFFYDPDSRVIGLAHAGWKPLVRGVVRHTVDAMVELGAKMETIHAFTSPGSGDRYTLFQWDDSMEEEVRSVFVEAGRDDLLVDKSLRHEMTEEDRATLSRALGRNVPQGNTFKISELAIRELQSRGLLRSRISQGTHSCLVDQYPNTAYCILTMVERLK
ncbi:hypothetical protein DL765_010665 [Monosporascus sp. GIB2]|nr:hypothetical protein DL765_010665 [Monosporascus sp. GIB2]